MADGTRYCTECGHEWSKRGKTPRYCSESCRPVCRIEDCDRKVHSGDTCRKHFDRRTGAPKCSVDDCSGGVWASGWCGTHYRRWERSGSLDEPIRPTSPPRCSVPDCNGEYVQKGFCAKHRWRMKSHGDPLWEPSKSPVGDQCSVVGCPRKVCEKSGYGFCRRHYRAYSTFGDPLGDRKVCPLCGVRFYTRGTRREMCDGCREVHVRHAKRLTARELADRDGEFCKICGGPVDFSIKWPHRMTPTVDHIFPWSRGGTHDEDNLQLAHWTCNLRKNNKVPAP